MNARNWIDHFERNRHAFREPDWHSQAPPADLQRLLDDPRRALLLRSLATFQLGESGGGSRLLRFVERENGRDSQYFRAMQLFVAEEQYHAQLLANVVHRLGGGLLTKHWSNSLFRGVRNLVNLEFNVQVLLTAELIAEAYYGFLHRQVDEHCLHVVTGKILADEVRHIRFHGEYFRSRHRNRLPAAAGIWSLQFQAIFLATERTVWSGHGACLSAFGVSRREFSSVARNCCRRFLESVLLPPARPTGRSRSAIAHLSPEPEQG